MFRNLARFHNEKLQALNKNRAFLKRCSHARLCSTDASATKKSKEEEEVDDVAKVGGRENGRAQDEVNVNSGRLTSKKTGKGVFLVPKVHSTDHIKQDEIHTEGLFAGNKPLFLGELSLSFKRPSGALDGIFGTLTKIKRAADDGGDQEIDIQGIINDLQAGEKDVPTGEKSTAKRPVIPWDASISGMVYSDEPFKQVPRGVVNKLKPFKLLKIERKNRPGSSQGHELVRMKVHNSKVNDELQLVDLSKESTKRSPTLETNDSVGKAKKYYADASKSLTQFKFIRSDQHIFKTDVDKLNNLLVKEFLKRTKLKIDSEFRDNQLPLYIYINKTLSSNSLLQRFLRKRVTEHISPLFTTILSSYEREEDAKKFEKRVQLRVDSLVEDLAEYFPSVFFAGDIVDCVHHPSPVPGFGRLYWLKPGKRHKVVWGRNFETDFVFNLSNTYRITRSGMRYMKYPINIHYRTFHQAFTEWEYRK
ncbi:LAQU0S07e00694g1_1 [Lachancea quebecensis]|uniref:LAQU0S07e00694g1_1 n=1 Tax=Lachancea quebecensis TaxID=1654605 RepID=A0A0P1KSS9_9SACH|nr:LAQU0S07e00694g1_1 [Lachancea quebecensis]